LRCERRGVELQPQFNARTLLGWLGVALTGSDTASNILFGNLQKINSQQLGLSPILPFDLAGLPGRRAGHARGVRLHRNNRAVTGNRHKIHCKSALHRNMPGFFLA